MFFVAEDSSFIFIRQPHQQCGLPFGDGGFLHSAKAGGGAPLPLYSGVQIKAGEDNAVFGVYLHTLFQKA